MTGVQGGPYDYGFAPRAVRDLEKLPESVAAACVEFIAGPLRDNPRRLGKPLLRGQWVGLWTARRGSYRVIYRLDDDRRRIQVVHIDHRSHVYR
jgi:mRNA-degrading endonuclease RelE of RelBE toxin-antitoxin system